MPSDAHTAYLNRLVRNDRILREAAADLRDLDYIVKATAEVVAGKRLAHLLYVYTPDEQEYTCIGFSEVPYRFYIGSSFSRGGLTSFDIGADKFPLDLLRVKEFMKPVDPRFERQKEILTK